MGDNNRAKVFVDFIERNYPVDRFKRVLDVAGGAGLVSLELIKRGYDPIVIDPKRFRHSKVSRMHRRFEAEMAKDADLVVAMHPDGATQEATRAARYAPSVIVPCCNYWPGHHGDVAEAVRQVLGEINGSYYEDELPISGKNLVLR